MCDPFVMAGVMVVQANQAQEAQMAAARATNQAFEDNQKLQNDAYTKDMEAFWDEEVAIQRQMYQNAEDAADAKIDMLIEDQARRAQLTTANLESGALGASSNRTLAVLRRQMADRSFDLDEAYQRGIVALKGEGDALKRDKVQRRYSAMGAINSMQRDPGLSSTDRALGLFSAGASGYAMGKELMPTGAKDITATTSLSSGTGVSRGSDYRKGGFKTSRASRAQTSRNFTYRRRG